MPSIHTTIEIAAPPSAVREVFLDFPSYSTWHSGTALKSVTPYTTASPEAKASKTGTQVKPGDILRNVLGNDMTFYPEVLLNSAEEFKWRGKLWGIPGVFTGEHGFRFEKSKIAGNEGGTTFVQYEDLTGMLTPLMREGSGMYKKTADNFVDFNKDLKAKCEEKK